MKYKQLLYLFIVSTLVAACGGNARKFVIVGSINEMPEQTVMLEQLSANDIISIVDSQRSDKHGKFEISGISPEPGLYRLHFSQNRFILLSIDKGTIKVNSDWNTIENYTISGSPGSESIRTFIGSIREHLIDINTMTLVLDSLKAQRRDSMLAVAQKDFQDMQFHFTEFVERYADTTRYEPNAIFASRMLNTATEASYLELFSQSINRRFPATKMTKDYLEFYSHFSNKTHQTKPTPSGHIDVGSQAPEISMASPDGKMNTLSSLKGKYVLLDFWASWCRPCRNENPNVVAAYQKYKDKNFTVFSVSLDNKKEDWEKAIKDDKLTWTNVSDLKGWSSEAGKLYGIQSIPFNFLIDPTGKIVAHDLRGDQLEAFLQAALK